MVIDDIQIDESCIDVVKAAYESGTFFSLKISGSSFIDISNVAVETLRDAGIPLKYCDAEDVKEALIIASEDRKHVYIFPYTEKMTELFEELVKADISFVVISNDIKSVFSGKFKLNLNLRFASKNACVSSLRKEFGEAGSLIFDVYQKHSLTIDDIERDKFILKELVRDNENPEKKLLCFLKMQGYSHEESKKTGTVFRFEENEEIDIVPPVVSDCFRADCIESSVPVELLLRMADKVTEEKSLKLLFCGGSGTGKTAFAHYLAKHLDTKVLLVKPSNIMQKWWGNSERNIEHMFNAAKKTDSLLLIDEIDVYLGKRGDSTEVNQKHWTAIVNMFLQEMEQFTGIMIGTTNMRENVDSAFIRRFHRIVEFDYPGTESISRLWNEYFPSFELADEELYRLSESKTLGPGDFASLKEVCGYMEDNEINTCFLVSELERAAHLRSGKGHLHIGFHI